MHTHAQNTPFLDSVDQMKQIDIHNALGSIEQLTQQIQEVWELGKDIVVPKEYANPHHIVVCGMGGSILGTDVIKSLYSDTLPSPITIVPDYKLPAFVNENSLVIAASYSGTTEETWTALQEAHKRGAKIAGVTSGGTIGEFLTKNNLPRLLFSTKHNPCGIAKMGLGYSIFGQIALFHALGLIHLEQSDFQTILSSVAAAQVNMNIHTTQENNVAKLLAFQLFDRIPYIMAADHLVGAAHVFTNQLNENAKTTAEYHVIPELNHHLLEAFDFPKTGKDQVSWVTLHSDLYQKDNSQRVNLTQQALEDHSIEFYEFKTTETTQLGQVFEVLTLGTYTSFYLAMLYSVDPGPIPVVDWFKAEHKKLKASAN